MSNCPICKAVNPDDYQFCQFCGSKIVNQALLDVAIASSPDPDIAAEITKPINSENVDLENANLESEEIANESIDNAIAITIPIILPEIPNAGLPESDNLKLLSKVNSGLSSETELSVSSSIHLPIYLQDIAYAGKTDVGRQRNRNEDDFVAIFQTRDIHGKSQISDRSQRGLFVLCDGMGGHEGGAEASAIAVNSITDQFLPFWVDTLPGEKKLNEIICNANQAIFDKNEEENRQSLGRMGTTLVMLSIHDLDVVIAHVGDSRIYKVTNNPNNPKISTEDIENRLEVSSAVSSAKLEQITRDHDVLNQLLDIGMDFESTMARLDVHQLTQALGPNPSDRLEPAIQFFTLTEPTLFLLCSDGLCDNDVLEENWQTHLLPILNKEIDLKTGLDNLIELGNNVNGYDNLTAILILCDLTN